MSTTIPDTSMPVVQADILAPFCNPSYRTFRLNLDSSVPIYTAIEMLADYEQFPFGKPATFIKTTRHCLELALQYLYAWETDPFCRTAIEWAFGEARLYWITLFSVNRFAATRPLRHTASDDVGLHFCDNEGGRHTIPWKDCSRNHPMCMSLAWHPFSATMASHLPSFVTNPQPTGSPKNQETREETLDDLIASAISESTAATSESAKPEFDSNIVRPPSGPRGWKKGSSAKSGRNSRNSRNSRCGLNKHRKLPRSSWGNLEER